MDYRLYELSVEVTNECPLNCMHCSSGSSPVKGPNELTFAEHTRIVEEAKALGAEVLSFSGGNPLMYDHLYDLALVASYVAYQRLLIYTTGHNRQGSKIYECKDIEKFMGLSGVTWIFSLHSHDAETNNSIMRTKNAFEDITSSIHWLTHVAKMPVEIHMVPMAPNFKDISNVRDLCAKLGVSKMSLLRFVPQTRGLQNVSTLGMNKDQFKMMQYMIFNEFSRNHPVQIRAGCPMDFRHSIGMLNEKAKPCHAGDDLMLVRPNGNVHPCAAWKSLPADSNVRTSSLKGVWEQSEIFNAIRKFKANGYKQVTGCASCVYVDSCKTGCPAQRLHADGKHMDDLVNSQHSDPLCWLGS